MGYNRVQKIMEKHNKKEETQSRRKFFKSAAKKSLPILGVIALSATPFRLSAVQSSDCASNSCTNGCKGSSGK